MSCGEVSAARHQNISYIMMLNFLMLLHESAGVLCAKIQMDYCANLKLTNEAFPP